MREKETPTPIIKAEEYVHPSTIPEGGGLRVPDRTFFLPEKKLLIWVKLRQKYFFSDTTPRTPPPNSIVTQYDGHHTHTRAKPMELQGSVGTKKKQLGLVHRIFTHTIQNIPSVVRDLAYPLFGCKSPYRPWT